MHKLRDFLLLPIVKVLNLVIARMISRMMQNE